MTTRKVRVPERWMRVERIGAYLIVPMVNVGRVEGERVRREDLFYRLVRNGKAVSDHGDKAGARYAARALKAPKDI